MPGLEWSDEFFGRKVVLTGACGVIGHWIAKSFAEAGARLCLSDQRGDELAVLADSLGVIADRGIAHVTNLSDSASIDDLGAKVAENWGAPDIVINNAGVCPSGFLIDIDAAEWGRIFDTNL